MTDGGHASMFREELPRLPAQFTWTGLSHPAFSLFLIDECDESLDFSVL
jgi:hypothetical protein